MDQLVDFVALTLWQISIRTGMWCCKTQGRGRSCCRRSRKRNGKANRRRKKLPGQQRPGGNFVGSVELFFSGLFYFNPIIYVP